MNTRIRKPHSVRLFHAAVASALLLVPMASKAQTFFGSGGSTNNAPANVYDLAFGYNALFSNTTGASNIAIGYQTLSSNTTGSYNTANGDYALKFNTTGSHNTAAGNFALHSNNTGWDNTASGYWSLLSNITGYSNTANGGYTLFSNTTGNRNTASGFYALCYNTTGIQNVANGDYALQFNTTGSGNTATGSGALLSNTTGYLNTGNGYHTLYYNTMGYQNTANGINALASNTTGSNNLAVGYNAGLNNTTGSNNIDIGNNGSSTDSGVIRIGATGTHTATYIAGISGGAASGGVAVYVNAQGQLYTLKSSRRFKYDIRDMGDMSDKLMQLRAVTYRYKDTHEKGIGLIAEEVAKVYPDLVQYDKQGKPFTIYYHLLTPMLLNQMQKDHREIMAQKTAMEAAETKIASLKSELAALKQSQQQQLAAITAKLNALVQTSPNSAQVQRAVYTQH